MIELLSEAAAKMAKMRFALPRSALLILLVVSLMHSSALAAGDLQAIGEDLSVQTAQTGASGDDSKTLPGVEWNQTFGGHYGDGAWCLQETEEGGYILVGNSASRGQGSDLFLVRTDANGNCTWSQLFGGSGEDAGYFVQQTRDGGFIAVGSSESFGMGSELLWLVKTDGNGSLLWDRTYGGFVSSSGDGGWSVDETDDGGYVIAGYTQSLGSGRKDMWLLRTDSLGNLLWQKTFGGQEDDVGMSVLESRDGGYIAAGRTGSFGKGGDDMWLVKTDSAGNEIWNATYGGKEDDAAFQVVETEDGYALVGRTASGSEDRRAALIKVNQEGRKLWQNEYTASSAASLALASDGGFVISGRLDSSETGRDALLIKTDSRGREQWRMTLTCGGMQTTGNEIGTFVVSCRDGSYALAGITDSCGHGAEDAWLVKIQAETADLALLTGPLGSNSTENITENSTENATGQKSSDHPSLIEFKSQKI